MDKFPILDKEGVRGRSGSTDLTEKCDADTRRLDVPKASLREISAEWDF